MCIGLSSSPACLIGGWDTETGEIHKEASAQIDQAFKNVDVCLKDAGGKGWDQVCAYFSALLLHCQAIS